MLDILSLEDKKKLFEKELQKFAYDVEILCALETGGKLEADEAYKKIRVRWRHLKALKKDLLPKAEPTDGPGIHAETKQVSMATDASAAANSEGENRI
ncbi:MAG: hypothetical protein HRU19_03140 [Pseudobacteriovorax sp.]|nr:hypothetical protein [Pseudobacteriovorax sp.]